MSNAKIVWANDLHGVARYILEVPAGLECNCLCPGCGARLEAVNSQNPYWKKRPHFRHYQAPELDDCATSAVLAAVREVVKSITEITLPGFEVTKQAIAPSGKTFTGMASVPEKLVSVEAAEFIDSTDAILTLSGGEKIRLRLVATTVRSSDPTQPVMGEIAINLSDPVLQTADPETLRRFISLESSAKTWCRYANAHEVEKIALDEANFMLETYIARAVRPEPVHISKDHSLPPFSTKLSPPKAVIKQHIPISDIEGAIHSFAGRNKQVNCYWLAAHPNSSKWGELIPTWETMFGEQYGDLLDAGLSAKERGEDATETLAKTAKHFGFTPQAIIGLWIAAGIAGR